jgi:LysM repeat protein
MKSSSRTSSQRSASAQHKSPSNAETQTTASAAVVHHKVKPGETLYSIANSYKTTVTALKQANRNIAVLRPGMILIVRDVR